MVSMASAKMNEATFAFSFQTSGGDKIELSMFDKKEMVVGYVEGSGAEAGVMSLRHSYGYTFRYEGDGLDEKDRQEIEAAMKKIKPLYEKFLHSIKERDEDPDFKMVTNLTQRLRDLIPSPKDENHALALKDKTVDMMDDLLKQFESNQKMLEESKKLFDKLFEEAKQFDFYA